MKHCFRKIISFTAGIFKAFRQRWLSCLRVREFIPPCNVHFMTMVFSVDLSALMNVPEAVSGQGKRLALSH